MSRQIPCECCKKTFDLSRLHPITLIRDGVWNLMKAENPDAVRNGYVCLADHQKYKFGYLQEVIREDKGELSDLEKEVVESLKEQEILSENINVSYIESLTFGERIADKVSSFGGSWKFITLFLAFIIGWMFLNTYILLEKQYDAYPYILLNLILSCLAAIQAPIIMMSQNRRADRDRIEAENDYKVNLKSELQIRQMNTKMEHFMNSQWNRLVEIQQLQADLINDLNELMKRP